MIIEEIRSILKQESEAIAAIPVNDNYQKAEELIYNAVHINKGKVVMSGMGKAGQIAMNMATTFCSTGTPAVFLHPAEAQHGDLGILRQEDILVLLSNSGKTREILELIELVKNMYEDIEIIVITGNGESELAGKANVVLTTGNPKEVCALGLTPTTSTTAMTVIGDILVVSLMKRINFTASEYALRHHGGYLGGKSRGMVANRRIDATAL